MMAGETSRCDIATGIGYLSLSRAIIAEPACESGEDGPIVQLCRRAMTLTEGDRDDIIPSLLAYGATDPASYRVVQPACLAEQQTQEWGALLAWLREHYDIEWRVIAGIGVASQTERTWVILSQDLRVRDNVALVGLQHAVRVLGSLVAGLALAAGVCDIAQAFRVCNLEELYQEHMWEDAELSVRLAGIRAQGEIAGEFLNLLRERA